MRTNFFFFGTMRLGRALALLFGAALMAALLFGLLAAKPAHADNTFTVNSTEDRGDQTPEDGSCWTGVIVIPTPGSECTLRAAIQEANATTGADTINFNIGGSGVKTISPATALPVITDPVTIDGYTQPGASENTLAFGDNAVLLIKLDGNIVATPTYGLSFSADNSVVRGLSVTRFSSVGIEITGASADNNTIEGNFVGIDPDGQDQGNGNGLAILDGASFNTVGGTSPGARNIISGNGPSNQFSGTGLGIVDGNATGNKVQGNYIGTTKSGKGDLGNTGPGLFVIEASGNIIGDDDPSDGLTNAANIIAFNYEDGVGVYGAASTGNRILSNTIFLNGGLGIDLLGAGEDNETNVVTPNDDKDTDPGANNLQNRPVVTKAKPTKKKKRKFTTITGTLNSTPGQTFTIQLFRNLPGEAEGRTLLTQFPNITTDAAGNASFGKRFRRGTAPVGSAITATATKKSTGDTSEFSRVCSVGSQCPPG